MGDLLKSMTVSASGLMAQAQRLNVVSQNIANVDTPGYQRKQAEFQQMFDTFDGTDGVAVLRVSLDDSALKRIYDPSHPLADPTGYYEGSNVSTMVEVADAREAQRSYEANLRSFDNARQMSRSLLELLKR
ncbi:flagellar basal-body rod protein FlgC [Dinoroseobacter shibae DFL 12 = DSM 16493]|jgi:flagellar basal-body rod protein FlgC|uniref:Flagellar basal-body rod protein FlgC n=1 Tax=Dinoroseobacter shibae (strain DSM 16493 / NCIMB 14021 / DFL 12) TaxID=398580 RepID=A8LMQ6_DINSH|nr:flagellar basal body rod protein FlgC [Dinoroseobacter shibae]ABV94981.1 flagellar basal-body rod protein FlgC [Dinoroseobacter shibae DFL 12 = DSM 16493]URF46400.1 flagellar basal body rod protein FlgC [Dinoroseobacter shibae]URF50706.1 flagellar basal body rod protein FlgC [Dinoroseobacter shibae]